MNETQTMTNEQLAAALGKHRALSVVFRLLTCAAGLGTILLFSGDSTPLAFACLVLTLVFGYQMGKHGQAVKTLLSDQIISGALSQVLEEVEYTPSRGIPSELVEAAGMVFPFEYNSSRGSDYIRGVYHGRKVALSDITLYQAESFYNEERSAWEERKEKKFQGQWLVCDFGQSFPGEVHLSENDRALRRQHKADGAETEDPAFHARFLVTAASPQEARSLLTPRMMSSILAAADGIVTVANGLDIWGGSYGYYIQIDHGGGLETLYAHCSSICVTTGQQVQVGQVIGYVGHTGRATGSHLHLEVSVDGNRADVLRYFTL